MFKTTPTAAFVMLTLSACSSSANLVRKDPRGGRVELEGAYVPAMSDARMLMVEHCGGRFEYVELGEKLELRCKSHGGEQPDSTGSVALHAASAAR
jgi:hypothetical protein